MGDRPAQTRFERLYKQSNEPPLSRVNTLRSGEDSMKLQELIDLYTKLSDRVLDLENVKNVQALEIQKLKKRVKKLESKKSRTPQLKRRLFKISWFQEDLETQGSAPVATADVSVSTVEPSAHPTTTTTTTPIEDEYLTIAQTLMKMKNEKSKAKGVTIQEPSESGTRTLQAELDKEARLKREREEEASKAVNIAEWDDVQAMKDADYELAIKLQAEEQGGYLLKKGYSFDEIKTLFETTMKKVNTFVPIESEVDRAVPELAAGSSKRDAKEELDQETFDRDDLVMMWSPVKEKFNLTAPTDDKEREIWVELKRLFEPDTDDELWKLQKHIHDLTWMLYDLCGVHHVSTEKGIDIYMLVEKEYPLSRGTLTLMLEAKLLVEQDNEMSRELLKKIFMQAERPRR
ncbi:hypothetical protein Tco_0863183 [Tanacetum coccineum]